MDTTGVVVGYVDCPRLRIYRDFLARRRYGASTLTDTGCHVLVVCADHLDDAAVHAAGAAFPGPKLVLGAPAPESWDNASTVRLPLLPVDLERRIARAVAPREGGGAAYRVLVVEDDPTIAASVARGLTDAGLSVQCCSGWVDLAGALQQRPDFILMDLNLPGLTGEKLGAIIQAKRIPTAIFSAEGPERLMEARRAMSAVDAFPKDTPASEMAARIREHLAAPGSART